MHKVNYQPVPYSFGRERHFMKLISSDKLSNQIETNQQSDTSDMMEIPRDGQGVRQQISYSSLIKSMREEVQYHKQAMKTAQNLITHYQKQNHNLKQQNVKLNDQLNSVTIKLQNVQRLLFKLFQFDKTQGNSPNKRNTLNLSAQMEKQSLQSFHRIDDQIQADVYKKIQNIYQKQMLYQQQILTLNNKIKLLQKHTNSDRKNTHKQKLKNSVNMPFSCNQTIPDQKIKIANRLIELYGNDSNMYGHQNVIKPTTKHSQFKKNLQKEFELFLEKTKTTVKTKTSITRNPNNSNSKSTHSISVSTQKKNSAKRSTSIPKKLN